MGRYKPHQTTILIGVSLALSPAICLLAFYKVILHALHRTIGTLLSQASFRQKEGSPRDLKSGMQPTTDVCGQDKLLGL
jgi:hypothetical protein